MVVSEQSSFIAISAGLPVLNNYPGWLAEMITARLCGYAVVPDNPQAFANALIHAADHREELPAMGQRARELAMKQYNRDVLGTRFVDWLEGAAK